jgi:hypothetical protein
MRTLGPGSVSSLLKTILDVVYYGLIVLAVVLGLAALAALLFQLGPDMVKSIRIDGADSRVLTRPDILAAIFAAIGIYVAGILIILNRLRKVFTTLTAGDPFHPDNVIRLRLVGGLLAGLEIMRYLVWAGGVALVPGIDPTGPSISLSGWFSILVVFVLAEVFREGARLRREAELTI